MRRTLSLLVLMGVLLSPGITYAQNRGWATNPANALDPARVDAAMDRAIAYLKSVQLEDGTWRPHGTSPDSRNTDNPLGPTALVVYSLLEAGVSPQDPALLRALAALEAHASEKTYTLGLICNVWQQANLTTANRYRAALERDWQQLVFSTKDGTYGYWADRADRRRGSADNSNAQYGLLGVWAAGRNQAEIPRQYWEMVMRHWLSDQNADGGWGYRTGRDSTATMTVAGIASMFVCYDWLNAARFVRCNVPQDDEASRSIRAGLEWLEQNFERSLRQGGRDWYYYMYGVERVGLAAGYKYFGNLDWYKLGVEQILRRQNAAGAFPGGRMDETGTAFALLFLARGRHPVAFNKLQHDGDWNNRPRDLANLTAWVTERREQVVNWQIVNFAAPVNDWHDAPVLVITGSEVPNFTDDQLEQLRQYVHQGGTILSIAECTGAGFRSGMRAVYQKLFPRYELTELGNEHEIYSLYYDLRGNPRVHMVSNGMRGLAFHVDADLTVSWQTMRMRTNAPHFQAAVNILYYITDMGILANRGVHLWPDAPQGNPGRTVRLARVRYNGNFEPEPLALERFSRLVARESPVKVDVAEPMLPSELAAANIRVAVLSGTGQINLPESEIQALQAFVESGGLLILEAAGGDRTFHTSAERLVPALSDDRLRFLPQSHPVYRLDGYELRDVSYRRVANRRLGGQRNAVLRGVDIGGRLAIVLSREDMTAGLVGYNSFGMDGYASDSAYQLMRNLVLYASESN